MKIAKPSLAVFNNWLRFVSAGIYIVSLTQSCFCTEAGCVSVGIGCLLSGTIGVFTGGAALTWLANPLIFISWFTIYKNPKLSLQTSIIAVFMALSFLLFKQVMKDEAGNYSKIISYNIGYWLWVLSAVTMAAGNLYTKNKKIE